MAASETIRKVRLGKDGPLINALGLGMMGFGNGLYGDAGSEEERFRFLDRAWELGNTMWDTADAYTDSEEVLGKWFAAHPERRKDIFLSTKFGLRPTFDENNVFKGVVVDSTPQYCKQALEASLKKLNVDYIDLYYIHRLDEKTPIEKTMEALVQLKNEGKIKHIGMSEVSSRSVRRAHAVHPVSAVQQEYNPWDLDIENETGTNLLATCRELGVSVVGYSPLGRGLVTGQIRSRDDFQPSDTRLLWPRFSAENFPKNLAIVDKLVAMAEKKGCTPGQLTLAWILAQGNDIIPIPGTKNIKNMEENLGALKVHISAEEEKDLRNIVSAANIGGLRAPEGLLPSFADTPEL